MKKYTIKLILLCLLGISPVWAQSTIRLERLNIMFEGNLSGAVYAVHCLQGGLASQPLYIENSRATAISLIQEILKQNKNLSKQQVTQTLKQQQNQMTQSLDDFYRKNGCSTPQAQSAKKHFDMFNQKTKKDMEIFLKTIENQ